MFQDFLDPEEAADKAGTQKNPIDEERYRGSGSGVFVLFLIVAVIYFTHGGIMAFLAFIVGVKIIQHLP